MILTINIGEEVNEDMFVAFYESLYEFSPNELANTQFVIVDKEYFTPKTADIGIASRYMTPEGP